MPIQLTLAVALVLLAVLVVAVTVITYNSVVALQRRADRAWANVDVCLRQRWDALPNLVAAVRGILGFEQAVLAEVTRLRATYSPTAPVHAQAVVAVQTSLALRSMLAVVEGYPQLRSQENVLALQEEIERLETLIARRRELFNEQVYQYNAIINQVPAALLRPVFGWQPREMFEAEEEERARPDVQVMGAGPS